MIISQVLNNNVVLITKNGIEKIIIGTGVGFQKKIGDEIEPDKVQKVFTIDSENSLDEISAVIRSLSSKELDIVLYIVNDFKEKTDLEISDSIFVPLADHIHYLLSRSQEGIYVSNPLHYEVKYLYPTEFELCKTYVDFLNEAFYQDIPDEEASSILLHFINASRVDSNMKETMQRTKIIKDLLNIITNYLKIQFDKSSYAYRRFIIHLQHFVSRVLQGGSYSSSDNSLVHVVRESYTKESECVDRIAKYLIDNLNVAITNDEFVYLVIHLTKLRKDIES
ncbi:PRD domain-containing protein [Fundicoccus culcitae]|uniref:PRD domain-containing protein n=1 Tax=Fundicoccus culcitae TaxID=2969821 RepID=A0ABY5P496_9LACT|nr:PRD domain-containing protein [Fundicoccus culcitae]UUX33563.1 PRD domain-containing protein [Fundicoccus culcitae]